MMRRVAITLATLLALTASVGEAQERRRGRDGEPQITLYELPNFQGRSISLYSDAANLTAQSFNDRAQSARIEGSWRLCEDKDYRSRCEPFADDVRDFGPYNFSNRITSVQQIGGRPARAGYEGPVISAGGTGYGRDGVEGRRVVFIRRPSVDGLDIAASGQGSADNYCRNIGLNGSAYFDEGERGRRAILPDGRVVENVPVLRDVLCRR